MIWYLFSVAIAYAIIVLWIKSRRPSVFRMQYYSSFADWFRFVCGLLAILFIATIWPVTLLIAVIIVGIDWITD